MKLKSLNNYVIVDLGTIGKTVETKKLPCGSTIYLAPIDTDNVDVLKVSGKVISAPKELMWRRENPIRYSVKPTIKEGDIVFFEPNTASLCEANGLVISKEKSMVLAIPYHLIICINRNGKIIMVNGKCMVKDTIIPEKTTESGIIIPDIVNQTDNYMEVVNIANDGLEGRYMSNGALVEFGDDGIKNGDIIVVNDYAAFNIQGIMGDIDEKVNYKKVNYDRILAVKKGEELEAVGVYCAGVPLEKESITPIILKKEMPTHIRVTSVGSGIHGIKVGDVVNFKKKKEPLYQGLMFVHEAHLLNIVPDKGFVTYKKDEECL